MGQVAQVAKRSVAVQLSGREYRIKSDAEEAWLQGVARLVEATMEAVRKRTGTVDSEEVALLAALNLARELTVLRENADDEPRISEATLRPLIELVESTTEAARASLG